MEIPIIIEIASNHEGKLERFKDYIDICSEFKNTSLKYQIFNPKSLCHSSYKFINDLEKVAISLSSSINTINDKMDESNENVIAAKDGIDKTYKKLEQNGDSLEQKLDAIIDALRYSNRSADEKRDKNEAAAKESFMQQQVDLSNANRILMQDMDRQEIRDMQAADSVSYTHLTLPTNVAV